jgi:hypothetical protein
MFRTDSEQGVKKMVKQITGRQLDGRDEFLIGLIAGFIPLVSLAAMIY